MLRSLCSTLALVCSLAGCGSVTPSSIDETSVTAARLVDPQLVCLAAMAGVCFSDTTLRVVTSGGGTVDVPVVVSGPMAGFGFEIGITDDIFELGNDLVIGTRDISTGRELFGVYAGTHIGLELGLGVQLRELANPHGATISGSPLAVGAGFFMAFEWLDIAPAEGGA